MALNFGFDFIRGEAAELSKPTYDEKLEYAAALIFSGLETEGLALLDEIPSAHSPLIHLYRAFGFFPRWEYERAEPELALFLSRTNETDYFYRVGQINRAASFVFLDRLDEAERLLLDILESTKAASTGLLRSNALELLAQVHLERGSLESAAKALEAARWSNDDPLSLYRLFIDKWAYVLELKRKPNAREAQRKAMDELIARARVIGHHETVRDLYLQTALVTKDEVALNALIAGTPHPAYRSRVRKAVRQEASRMQVIVSPGAWHEAWSLEGSGSDEARTQWVPPDSDRKSARLLRLLLSDLFSPWRLPQLYQALFPGRWYDASSARNLMHQSVHELRRDLKARACPIDVRWERGSVYLQSTSAFRLQLQLRLHIGSEPDEVADSLLQARALRLLGTIEARFKDASFSAADLASQSQVPSRSLQRHLRLLVETGQLERIGGGRSVRYRLPR